MPGIPGISPPNVCTKQTQLLGIYAMLIYIWITFPRNAYYSNDFSENSLVYGNVLQSLGVLRSSCSPLISVVCISVLPRPSLKGVFRSLLFYNVPIIHRAKTCFGGAVILTTWSDNIPCMLHLLHSQVSIWTLNSLPIYNLSLYSFLVARALLAFTPLAWLIPPPGEHLVRLAWA